MTTAQHLRILRKSRKESVAMKTVNAMQSQPGLRINCFCPFQSLSFSHIRIYTVHTDTFFMVCLLVWFGNSSSSLTPPPHCGLKFNRVEMNDFSGHNAAVWEHGCCRAILHPVEASPGLFSPSPQVILISLHLFADFLFIAPILRPSVCVCFCTSVCWRGEWVGVF